VTWDKPEQVAATYPRHRWRQFMMDLWKKRKTKVPLFYARYLCRDWNSRHQGDRKLESLEIYFMREETQPDYEISAPQKVLIRRHACGE